MRLEGTGDFDAAEFEYKIRESGVELLFRNYYRCTNDGSAWIAEWSCMCNDRCPVCSVEIEPDFTEDIPDATLN
jgi:hypothetical protein